MAKIPPLKRLTVEDFPDQSDWIGRLLQPINNFNEQVTTALSRGLTLGDNLASAIQTVTVDSAPTTTSPIKVAWSLKNRPISVHVGNVRRLDGADFTLSNAVQVQWTFSDSLRITNIVGLSPTPSGTDKYLLTLVIFAG